MCSVDTFQVFPKAIVSVVTVTLCTSLIFPRMFGPRYIRKLLTRFSYLSQEDMLQWFGSAEALLRLTKEL